MRIASNIALVVTTCLLCGCNKIADYYNYNEPAPRPKCRVVSVILRTENDESRHTVTYNDAGLPEYVSEYYHHFEPEYEYEDINSHLYDDKNRLISEGPGSTPSPYVYVYVYDGDSPLPIRDTFFINGNVYVEDFSYDQQGRLIKIVKRAVISPDSEIIAEPDEVTRYYYDIRGNRQEHPSNISYNGLIEYTDKPSLYALNRVWQIRYRDFSKNSTLAASTFNEHGLPVTFKDSYRGYLQPFLNVWYGSTVTYECE
jgi:hypothetical protein